MEHILDAPTDVEKKLNYAGFWIRFAAYMIDGILLWVVNTLITLAFFGSMGILSPVNPGNVGFAFLPMIISLAINIFYFVAFESSSKQATLGKMAVGIKVGNRFGEQLSFGNALGRYVGKILSAITLTIGFMMAGWDDKKQALHDKLANTYVYYK